MIQCLCMNAHVFLFPCPSYNYDYLFVLVKTFLGCSFSPHVPEGKKLPLFFVSSDNTELYTWAPRAWKTETLAISLCSRNGLLQVTMVAVTPIGLMTPPGGSFTPTTKLDSSSNSLSLLHKRLAKLLRPHCSIGTKCRLNKFWLRFCPSLGPSSGLSVEQAGGWGRHSLPYCQTGCFIHLSSPHLLLSCFVATPPRA